MNDTRLKDVYDFYTGPGIFAHLTTPGGPPAAPWAEEYEDINSVLNVAYGAHSAHRIISPIVEQFLVNGSIPADSLATLANVLRTKYGQRWNKLWETLNFEYNPIENYDSTETERIIGGSTRTPNLTENETRTPNLSHTSTHTETPGITETETTTRTPNLTTTTETENATSETVDGIYGFNSSTPVNSDTSKTTDNGTVTENATGTEQNERSTTRTGTDTRTTEETENGTETTERTHTGTETTSENTERTLTRKGNIGVTTSQQMIQSERDLWMWTFFDEVVFPDMDSLLALTVW